MDRVNQIIAIGSDNQDQSILDINFNKVINVGANASIRISSIHHGGMCVNITDENNVINIQNAGTEETSAIYIKEGQYSISTIMLHIKQKIEQIFPESVNIDYTNDCIKIKLKGINIIYSNKSPWSCFGIYDDIIDNSETIINLKHVINAAFIELSVTRDTFMNNSITKCIACFPITYMPEFYDFRDKNWIPFSNSEFRTIGIAIKFANGQYVNLNNNIKTVVMLHINRSQQ